MIKNTLPFHIAS